MRTALALSLLFVASMAVAAAARIVLTDGSIVVCEVRSMQDGVYRVETRSLGLVEIHADRIVRIEQGGGGSSSPARLSRSAAGEGSMGQVRMFQQQIGESPELMRLILALQEDPELMGRVCRYITRPPVADKRLSLAPDGDIRYKLKSPYRDGTTLSTV